MHQYLLKNLFLSSLLTLLLYSCSPTAGYKLQGKMPITEAEVLPLIPKSGSLLFKAKIDLYSKHFSGLIIVKQTDSLTAHVSFVTEIGMKMFDFEIREQTLKLMYIFEPLNRPELIRVLSSDLELLLLQKAYYKESRFYKNSERICYVLKEDMKYYYFVNPLNNIEKVLVKGSVFKKIKLNYSYKNNQALEHIHLKHKGFFPLKMTLISLSGENQ